MARSLTWRFMVKPGPQELEGLIALKIQYPKTLEWLRKWHYDVINANSVIIDDFTLRQGQGKAQVLDELCKTIEQSPNILEALRRQG